MATHSTRAAAGIFLLACLPSAVTAQRLLPPAAPTRTIDFTTDEGTGMSVAVAPTGRWIAFDLLGHVYRLPLEGGTAVALTQSSGPALNFHPAISSDGKRIAFISDRHGQNNVWVMDADGTNARPILEDLETRFTEPTWAPDGTSIVAVRAFPTPGRGWHRQTKELWQLFLNGERPRRLLGQRLEHYESPRFSPDGRYLYYHVAYSVGDGLGLLLAGHRIQRLELATGTRVNVRTDEPTDLSPAFITALKAASYAEDVAIDPPAALAPALSPDGRQMAFALEEPGQLFSWRGHAFGPRTGLYLRDLSSGAERLLVAPIAKELTQTNAQYYYRVTPAFDWTPDGRSIVIGYDGKLRRIDVASGASAVIPFEARVHRVIAAQPRSDLVIGDSTRDVRFIQWPAGSPDGRRLAFVGAGAAWVMDLPGGTPRRLTPEMPGSIQLTPAWSPDGTRIAFTSWNDTDRGAVWTVPAGGGTPVKLTDSPGEYAYPVWSPDGRALVVSRGPGPDLLKFPTGWGATSGWELVRLPVTGGSVEVIGQVGTLQPSAFGPAGRLYFPYLAGPDAVRGLFYPFPTGEAEQHVAQVRSVAPDGTGDREELEFPATRPSMLLRPVLSPDGQWVAFEADRTIWLRRVNRLPGAPAPRLVSDPNTPDPERIRVGDLGGIYQSWRDRTTLQFASGNRYVTYDVTTRALTVTPVRLRLPVPAPRGAIALVGAKVITVDGDRVIGEGTVVVKGARITCVGRCDTTGVDRVVDARGKTIIPGLVDVHAHHTESESGIVTPHRPPSALALAYGVTSIIDPATMSESAFPLAEMVDAGVVTGPRVYSSAEYVIFPGRAWGEHLRIRTAADAEYEVARRKAWGAIEIKNYRQANRLQHQWIIEAARRHRITVTSEGGPLYFDVGLAIDGQTGWEHFLADIPLYKDAATFFAKAGVVYSPTVIVAGHVNGAKEYYRPRQGLLDDPKYNRFAFRPGLEAQHRNTRVVPLTEVSFPMVAEGVADILRAGGHAAIGEHGEQVGIGSHWEIWAYSEALTPLEAIRMATLDGAYFMGLDGQLGSITAGKLADLVVLNGDPTADIRQTANIQYVMKNGILYDGATLDEVWPSARAYGPTAWH